MDASEMMKLRTGDSATGAARIMRALERSNANNLMIKLPSDSEAAIENIQKFTNAANVNLLDAIVDGKSRAARGHVPISGAGRNYFSLAGNTDARLGRGGLKVAKVADIAKALTRSEEHTSELQSLMRNSFAVFCLK